MREKIASSFKILGSGPMKKDVENMAKELRCNNIDFLGYIEHPLMAAYLVKSDILVNSFVKGAPQSIVNKIGDYLAAGKPIINTLENVEMCGLIEKYRIGLNVQAENPQAFVAAQKSILSEKIDMGKSARKLAEEGFDRKNSYKKIVDMISELII